MKYSVVLPAHNEANYIEKALSALFAQDCPPQEVVVVDDHSTDTTAELVNVWIEKKSELQLVQQTTAAEHQPGEKVIQAFLKGVSALTKPFDVLVKLDADVELPKDYFRGLAKHFEEKSTGIAGGVVVEKKEGQWKIDHPMNHDHVRGAIKAYSKECYDAIGGLLPLMGWDTLDEHLARFYGFQVICDPALKAKHHRPLGKRYAPLATKNQGRAFYRMRYGFWLSALAIVKYAYVKQSFNTFLLAYWGYLSSFVVRPKRAVTKKEGQFIRNYRFTQIKNKFKSF